MSNANKLFQIFDLLKKGFSDHGALVLQIKDSNNIYVQFSFSPSEKSIWWEAVSNEYLDKSEQLTLSQIEILESMGFSLKGNPNFFKTIKIEGDETFQDIAEKTLEIFNLVYNKGINPLFDYDFID